MVVVLDLSDRLLVPGQSEKDRAAIFSAFEVFENSVRAQLFIKSKDVFSVVILPQRNSALNGDHYETRLRLDMSRIPVAQKSARFAGYKKELWRTLAALYAEAGKGTKPSDYFGVDIWQFFNQSVNDYLSPTAANKVLLLTDGFLDFESDKHTVKVKNRYTSSRFLPSLTGSDWKQVAQAKDLGFYPVQNKITACSLIVAGLSAKYGGQSELDKLKFFWSKWLGECEVKSYRLISNANPAQFGATISSALK